jgi:hypothetical protein
MDSIQLDTGTTLELVEGADAAAEADQDVNKEAVPASVGLVLSGAVDWHSQLSLALAGPAQALSTEPCAEQVGSPSVELSAQAQELSAQQEGTTPIGRGHTLAISLFTLLVPCSQCEFTVKVPCRAVWPTDSSGPA